jgi:hypothetical protein
VLHAKEAANKASAELSKARKSIDDIKAKLGKDWGPEWEWKKLEGTCIDKDTGEYVPSCSHSLRLIFWQVHLRAVLLRERQAEIQQRTHEHHLGVRLASSH